MAEEEIISRFRVQAIYMKTWKPNSAPSNRDRLELYALHKQAVSDDAPKLMPSSAISISDKAKYNAWKSKNGLIQGESMRLYLQESQRQIRIYGVVPTKEIENESNIGSQQNNVLSNCAGSGDVTESRPMMNAHPNSAPRGLAAIPLLCAAASESRLAYIRRLSDTNVENSWWSRQEPLCAIPGSICSFPENVIIGIASLVEFLSLASKELKTSFISPSSIQSYLWPLHNCLLSLWMGVILLITVYAAGFDFLNTILWGGRRTGLTLSSIFHDKVHLSSDSINTMTEAHQPISVRLVGLALLPYAMIVKGFLGVQEIICGGFGISGTTDMLIISSMYIIVMGFITWFYWLIVCPLLGFCLIWISLLSGNCFALIDLAGIY